MSEQTTFQVVEKKSNGLGVAGFVLSLVAVFFCWVPFLNWISWTLGLIFSAIGISNAKKTNSGKGLSIAGLVISLVGLAILLILTFVLVSAVAAAASSSY